MTQRRKGLIRNGSRWCSEEEMRRLQQDVQERPDDLKAAVALARREWRCGERLKPDITKESKAGFGRLTPKDKAAQDLIVSVIEGFSRDGVRWSIHSSLSINMLQGRSARSWSVGVESYLLRGKERNKDIRPDYKRVLTALKRIGKEQGWRSVSGWGEDKTSANIDVAPEGTF